MKRILLAIPTFARKYRTTCHIAYPKLTAFGESYRLNGYQIPEGEEAYIKEEPVREKQQGQTSKLQNNPWQGIANG